MHATRFFIKPAPGIRIADPLTGAYLPEEGMLVPRSGFWLRRVRCGDVVESGLSSPPDDKARRSHGKRGENRVDFTQE